MKTIYIMAIFVFIASTTACGAQTIPAGEPNVPDQSQEAEGPDQTIGEAAPSAGVAAPNCLGDEISPIGQSIANDYETASYEQVIAWFCNGAEFEDILVALETEAQTGTPADDMLQMLADGFTWEEIWQLVGLTE